MKRTILNISVIGLLSLLTTLTPLTNYSQCPNNNTLYGSSGAPTTIGSTSTLTTCIWGGEYRLVTGLVAGSLYSFETCGNSAFDTQITIYDNVTGAYVAYNDDFCGLQSKVTVTATGNNLRVLVDRYSCANQSSCMTLKATRISGPPAVNPCSSITPITCGVGSSYSLSGSGAWNSLGGPYSTPGSEQVFSYTAPVTGAYSVSVTSSTSWVDLFYKSGSCSSSGWTYVDDISSSGATNSVNLVAGVTYYFLLDRENTSAGSGSLTIACPCVAPPGGIDATYTYTSPFVISGTTVGACNDCSLRSSNDRVYAVNIPCNGSYTFSTCGGASWDTYLYLRSAPCGGSSIALNDDACGLQSSVTAILTPGTYYIHLEGFSSASQGSFNLNVSGTLFSPSIGSISGPSAVCPNETGVTYVLPTSFDSYSWSVPSGASITSGAGTNSITVDFGSSSGNVSVVGSNACGTNSSSLSLTVLPTPNFTTTIEDVSCFGGSDGSIIISPSTGSSPFTYTVGTSLENPLIISGVIDGPLSGGTPKAVELYAIESIADLSIYGLGSANNGGGTDGQEFTFPAVSVSAGSYITVSYESLQFGNFLGSSPSYTSGSMGINGDDAIELFKSGSVIDVFGNINVDGSGQPWEYLDGWAYRDNGSLPNNGSWDISEWSFSGKNALDGESSNATASSPFPIGSFTSSGGGSSTTQSSDTFSGLTEGTYSISITDANGCVSASQTVDIGSNPIPEISISITDVSCFGGSDGSVSISPSVGDAPFTYFLVNALENALIISGVIDGPLSGGTPKAVELYVIDAISDLSIYGLGSANNGGGTDGQEFTFPAVSVSAGSYITVSYEALQFGNFLGSSPSYTSGSMGINGDDAIELFKSGAVIDVFGNINVDGTGQPWEYLDGWAYRNSGSFTNDGVWDISEWSFSGKNALDGESSNATASSPFPIGSFTTTGSSGGTSQTSNVFTGLSAGSSSVYVEDANGCVSPLEDVLISEPDLLVASSSAPQILCIGGMTDVTVSASGGVAPYSGAGTFTVNEGTYNYLITDNNGCTASTTITTTVVPDVTAPTINCPADAAVNTDSGVCEALISIDAPTSSDNCSVASVINDYNGTSDASDTYPLGTTTVTWTVTDGSGNTANCSMDVTVTDTETPSIACSADVAVNSDPGVCEAMTTIAAPTTSDNCSVVSVINDYNGTSDASDTYPLGTTTVTWTVTDGSGNTANCSMDVTVTDTEDPSIACSADVAVNSDPGICEAQVTITAPSSGDNCSVASVVNDYNGTSDASDVYPLGTTSVIWTVTDGSGNTSSCSMDVTVTDAEAPSIACSADVDVNNDPGICEAQVTITAPSSGDNCSVASVVNDYNGTSDASDVYPLGATTVTWTVTDGSGNTSSCSMSVTVSDNEAPSINCPGNVAVNTDSGVCAASISIDSPTTSDNCSVASVINDYNGTSDASDTYPLGTTTITWTVTDGSGNTSSCSMDVTVTDVEIPTINCPANVSVNTDAGVCEAMTSIAAPVSSDNCSVASVINDYNGTSDASDIYPLGTTTVSWTVTDGSGNTASCTMNVTVTDNETPVINCPADVAVNTDAGICEAMTTIAAPASSDNCSVVSVTNDYNGTSDASDTYPLGTTTVTWTVTDGSGNTSNCSMDVTVTDAELPVIDCPSDIVLSECTPTASWDLIASDNCGVSSVSSDIPSGSTFAEGTTTNITITAIDNSGNVANCTFSVTRDPDLVVSATADPILCSGDTTVVVVTAIGGAPPYTGIGNYSEVTGTYTYTVTDSKGCSESTTITIAEPTPLVADANGCSLVYGGAGIEFGCATIDGSATGGTPGYSYDWSTSETTSSIIVCPDSTSTYTLSVTDANGCITTIDWTVEQVDISCTPGRSGSGSGSHSSHSHSGSGSGSGSGSHSSHSHSGSGSGSSSGISYASHASGVSCPSGSGSHSGSGSGSHSSHSHSGSGSGSHSSHSGSGSGSSSSCHLSKYSKISHQISDYSSASGSDCKSNSNAGKKDKVLMCFEGETYCVQQKHIQKRLNCGYTLGPCDAQQTAACSNAQVDNDSVSCVCDGKLVSLTVRYIGPSNQDINVTAKKCNVTLLSASNATTGDVFTIDASAAGLDYLRKETYFELAGTDFGPVKIPTNCCDNPVGRFFFPFEVIAWTDTEGNECSSSAAKANGSDRTKPETEIATVKESGPFIQQYPNPADQNATFEFTVTKDQEITVTVMNIRGKVIQTLYSGHAESMMTYRVDYNVSSIESGIYFVHLNTTEGVFKKKFVILR